MDPQLSGTSIRADHSVTHVGVQTDESEVEKQYKKRIEELEARVAELEHKQ
jgi:chaperonin cofactor prefoldin